MLLSDCRRKPWISHARLLSIDRSTSRIRSNAAVVIEYSTVLMAMHIGGIHVVVKPPSLSLTKRKPSYNYKLHRSQKPTATVGEKRRCIHVCSKLKRGYVTPTLYDARKHPSYTYHPFASSIGSPRKSPRTQLCRTSIRSS